MAKYDKTPQEAGKIFSEQLKGVDLVSLVEKVMVVNKGDVVAGGNDTHSKIKVAQKDPADS